jgi:hypothetical protein
METTNVGYEAGRSSEGSSSPRRTPKSHPTVFDRLFFHPLSLHGMLEVMLSEIERTHGSFLDMETVLRMRQSVEVAKNDQLLLKTLFLVFVANEAFAKNMVLDHYAQHCIEGEQYSDKVLQLFVKALDVKVHKLLDSNFVADNVRGLMEVASDELRMWWRSRDVLQLKRNSIAPDEISHRSTGCDLLLESDRKAVADRKSTKFDVKIGADGRHIERGDDDEDENDVDDGDDDDDDDDDDNGGIRNERELMNVLDDDDVDPDMIGDFDVDAGTGVDAGECRNTGRGSRRAGAAKDSGGKGDDSAISKKKKTKKPSKAKRREDAKALERALLGLD